MNIEKDIIKNNNLRAMKPNQLTIFIILFTFYFRSYCQPTEHFIQKTIILNNEFTICFGDSENFGDFTTFTYIKLTRNEKNIFEDKTGKTEYEIRSSQFPIIISTLNNSFQLLAEVNDRPSKNYLKCFIFKDNELKKVEQFPTFLNKAKNLDGDSCLEFAGIWDNGEEWTSPENIPLSTYNPIIYYEVTHNGLKTDSALTISRNKYIYGQFHGYRYNEKLAFEVNKIRVKLKIEIERIEN